MYNVSYLMCIPPLCCVGCDLYSIGPVTLVGKLARTGYAPGETIELTVEVNNATWPEFFTQIRQVKLELYNNITMHAEGELLYVLQLEDVFFMESHQCVHVHGRLYTYNQCISLAGDGHIIDEHCEYVNFTSACVLAWISGWTGHGS